jgi:hypothetical protein
MEDIKHHWSVDRRINLSHLVTTFMIVVGLFQWGNKMDVRVSTLETNFRNTEATSAQLYKRLERIEDKLDRLIEHDINRKR